MFCVRAPRTLWRKEYCSTGCDDCWGNIFCLSEPDSQKFGFKGKVFFGLKHFEETKNPTMCCFPWRSDNEKCSDNLAICPQHLVKVFEAICPAKTYSKICRELLKKADNNERIIGNKHYTTARKVSSGGKIYNMGDPSFIALSRKSELQRFHGLRSLLSLITSDKIPKAKYLKLPRFHQGITQTGVMTSRRSWRHWKRKINF